MAESKKHIPTLEISFEKTPAAKPYSVAFARFSTPSMSLKLNTEYRKKKKHQKRMLSYKKIDWWIATVMCLAANNNIHNANNTFAVMWNILRVLQTKNEYVKWWLPL